MPIEDGKHLICKKHKIGTYYDSELKTWYCVECRLERK